jgi:hypothetical protein
MAKYEQRFTGDFDEVLKLCERTILQKSTSASSEDNSDAVLGGTRVAVRVYERFSVLGGNRVSLNLTLVGQGNDLFLTAITAGGSQGLFFKINTWGESAFLDTLVPALESYISQGR